MYADDVGRYVRTGELGRESLGSEVAILERMGHLFRERRKLESFVESRFVMKCFAEWLRCRLSIWSVVYNAVNGNQECSRTGN